MIKEYCDDTPWRCGRVDRHTQHSVIVEAVATEKALNGRIVPVRDTQAGCIYYRLDPLGADQTATHPEERMI